MYIVFDNSRPKVDDMSNDGAPTKEIVPIWCLVGMIKIRPFFCLYFENGYVLKNFTLNNLFLKGKKKHLTIAIRIICSIYIIFMHL